MPQSRDESVAAAVAAAFAERFGDFRSHTPEFLILQTFGQQFAILRSFAFAEKLGGSNTAGRTRRRFQRFGPKMPALIDAPFGQDGLIGIDINPMRRQRGTQEERVF